MSRKYINILAFVVGTILIIGYYLLYNEMMDGYYYLYEYEYGDLMVRRYDRDEVTLELLKNGKVVDRVKAIVDRANCDNLYLGLYFDPSGQVLITDEDCNRKYWRSPSLPYLYTHVLKKEKNCFFLGYLTDMSLRSAEQISEKLEYLQYLKEDGRFYYLNEACHYLDTLYNYSGENPVAVKMRVFDKDGNIIYSNGE